MMSSPYVRGISVANNCRPLVTRIVMETRLIGRLRVRVFTIYVAGARATPNVTTACPADVMNDVYCVPPQEWLTVTVSPV